jgi:N-acetylneuraminate synthase/N,N'-diacetyllegionaminate synthase
MEPVRIGEREVGPGRPVYLIAEAGSNHNGNLETAFRLIDAAAQAGADAVKFQIFRAEDLYSRRTPGFRYLGDRNVFDLIRGIETPRTWIPGLARHCADRGIQFLASPFDRDAVDLLDPFVPAYKIASFEIVDLELIAHAAGQGKPMILSTGMASLGEIEDALRTCRDAGNDRVLLLHCSSLYPSPPGVVNLRAMETMARAFGVPVGLSDHTLGTHIAVGAAAMGACIIEKHFTLDRTMEGPDHAFAVEPEELAALVRTVRDLESALGTGVKERSALEDEEMYRKARRSVHARVSIPRGTVITREMLSVKRPGYGILPRDLPLIPGRKAARDIAEDEWIGWEMLS